jgi:hypothetical protein
MAKESGKRVVIHLGAGVNGLSLAKGCVGSGTAVSIIDRGRSGIEIL